MSGHRELVSQEKREGDMEEGREEERVEGGSE